MSDASFTPEELANGEQHYSLGPAYFAAREIAEKFMAPFEAEHFKPLIDKFARDFQDKLWSDLEASLLSDVESNLQGSLWRMVDGTINALLTGDEWALNRYILAGQRYSDAAKVREAILKHCGEQLTAVRVTELEAQVSELRADCERLRGRF